jgi:sugar phosphate isomerase/epimerase
MVLHPCGVFSFQGQEVGEYAFLIDSLREIAGFMADNGLILSLENQVLRHPDLRIIAACSSDEWFQLYKDVNCGNVTLTLDTSHAASAVAHEPTAEERFRKLQDFLSHPEWVTHFHWSDARLTTDEAKWSDMHLVPGTGDLPLDFHRAIKQHGGSILFEQNCSEAELEAGLRFYESL